MKQGRLGDGIPPSCQKKGSRAMPLPLSPCERDIFHLPCCPNPARVKGRRRKQQVNGRRRLTSELAKDVVNSLNWLAGHKNSSRTPRMHGECVDNSSVPSGAISVMNAGDRCSAVSTSERNSGLLCLVISREPDFLQENGCIAPVGSARLIAYTSLRCGGTPK